MGFSLLVITCRAALGFPTTSSHFPGPIISIQAAREREVLRMSAEELTVTEGYPVAKRMSAQFEG